jgi:phosphatidylglycerol:prolipoprotein diacylglycerol transferase
LSTIGPALVVHAIFEWLALGIGAQIYRRTSAQSELATADSRKRLLLVFGAVAGAAIGNKLVYFIYDPDTLRTLLSGRAMFLGGQSIVGGLLGGLLGVELAKKLTGIASSTGDAFVVPILAGILIGRIGCFIAGLHDATFGNPTTLPWGYDFGDGVHRHPTQIYDQLFALALLAVLARLRPRLAVVPGLQFKLMLTAYLIWRLVIDSIKPKPFVYPMDFSGIQLVCLAALLMYLPLLLSALRKLPGMRRPPASGPIDTPAAIQRGVE